jgi:hypothetical protein
LNPETLQAEAPDGGGEKVQEHHRGARQPPTAFGLGSNHLSGAGIEGRHEERPQGAFLDRPFTSTTSSPV